MPVDTQHPDYAKALPDWKRNRDVVEGERAVKLAGETYLPRLTGQGYVVNKTTGKRIDEYEAYKERASFFPATSRTLDGLTGLIFRKDPQAELPAAIEPYVDDIDMRGQALPEFAQKLVDDLMMAPHGGILVEFPQAVERERRQSEAEAEGLRPYLTHYTAESVINWRTGRVANHVALVEVRLMENIEEPDPEDSWKSKTVQQIRVLRLTESEPRVYEVIIFQKRNDPATNRETWIEVRRFVPVFRGVPSSLIPFVFLGPRDTSPEVQKAPLTDIAGVNVAHYRNSADYENGVHWTGCPTPIFIGDFQPAETGEKVTEVRLGSASGIQMQAVPGTDAKFLEFQGKGLDEIFKAMQDKKESMAVLGARILAEEKKAAEAAETAAIHRAGENSVLASLANAVSKAIEISLGIMAKWSGDETSEISYRLNTDYQVSALAPQALAELVRGWQADAFSDEELYDQLQRGELIRDDKTYLEHQAEIEAQREAKAARKEEQAQADLARTAALLATKGKAPAA